MNERIIKLGLESGMLNYVDNETPRHYFLCGNADEECLVKFAELIVRECANVIADNDLAKDCGTIMMDSYAKGMRYSAHLIKEHFGVK